MSDSTNTVRTIIGLEIHVQLRTRSKMFCGCRVGFEAPPNTLVCPVCLGHPGSLPVINREAFRLSVLAGLALDCRIARHTKWDRKSYYYPDMPKNYQISQYDLPLAFEGFFDLSTGGESRRIRIRRAHLEEDAGKNIHDTPGCTLVDLNRAGTPLLEVVTEPDLTSGEEAYAFCTELQRLVTYLGVSEGNMKKGQMRFEPNVNLAIDHDGSEVRTPIVEIKNLNSFRAVRDAIGYESQRQLATWREDHGYVLGSVPNENRGWNADKGVTQFQRVKEAAHDYRYFPDPDLVPIEVSDEMLDEIRSSLPELPIARRRRMASQYGLSEEDAETIVANRRTADLFERVIESGGPSEVVSKQFVNTWQRLAKDRSVLVPDLGIDADRMAELARITAEGAVNKTAANRLAEVMVERVEKAAQSGETTAGAASSPLQLAEELNLVQVTDAGATEAWVKEAFAQNEQAVQDALRNPKKLKAAAGFLRGQVMRLSQGQADPKLVGEMIEAELASLR